MKRPVTRGGVGVGFSNGNKPFHSACGKFAASKTPVYNGIYGSAKFAVKRSRHISSPSRVVKKVSADTGRYIRFGMPTSYEKSLRIVAAQKNIPLDIMRVAIDDFASKYLNESKHVNGELANWAAEEILRRREIDVEPLVHRRRGMPPTIPPKLPEGLSWPSEKYSDAVVNGIGIVDFLRTHWKPLIQAGYNELRWVRAIDKSAAVGIANFERIDRKTGQRRSLPCDVQFLRPKDITDRDLASLDGAGSEALKGNLRLTGAIAYRLRRGLRVPLL